MKKPKKWVQKVKRALIANKNRKSARWYGGFETYPLVLPGTPEFPKRTAEKREG